MDRRKAATVPRALVDTTGSEYTWLPEKTLRKIGINVEKKDLAFTMANGQRITRSVGFAIPSGEVLYDLTRSFSQSPAT